MTDTTHTECMREYERLVEWVEESHGQEAHAALATPKDAP